MAYEIQFITDQRFKGTKAKLKAMDKRLKLAMDGLACVSLKEVTGIREIDWDDGTKQWRKKYIISKSCRKPTWNEVMMKINEIQAPYYKRV